MQHSNSHLYRKTQSKIGIGSKKKSPNRVPVIVACSPPSWQRHSLATVSPATCTNPLISGCSLTRVKQFQDPQQHRNPAAIWVTKWFIFPHVKAVSPYEAGLLTPEVLLFFITSKYVAAKATNLIRISSEECLSPPK